MNVARRVMPRKCKGYWQRSESPGTDGVLCLELRGFWVRVRTTWGNPVPEKLLDDWGRQVPQNQGVSHLETTNAFDLLGKLGGSQRDA